MTDEQLSAIDRLLAAPGVGASATHTGQPSFCALPHPEVDLLNAELRADGWTTYANLPPFRSRRAYERSLWIRRDDNRCVPELHALASLKFGVLHREPYWTDGDWTHADISNVSVLDEAGPSRPVSKYGVRSTTKEYRKRYYAEPENRARQRTASREHAKKKRALEHAAKKFLENASQEELEALKKKTLMPDGRAGDDDDRDTTTLVEPEDSLDVNGLLEKIVDAKQENN